MIKYKGFEGKKLSIKPGTIGIADMDWFKSKKISSVRFPESLRYIGSYTFNGADINFIKLPHELCYIGSAAFRGTKLKNVYIPFSVKTIDIWVFMDCEQIESISFASPNTDIIWIKTYL